VEEEAGEKHETTSVDARAEVARALTTQSASGMVARKPPLRPRYALASIPATSQGSLAKPKAMREKTTTSTTSVGLPRGAGVSAGVTTTVCASNRAFQTRRTGCSGRRA